MKKILLFIMLLAFSFNTVAEELEAVEDDLRVLSEKATAATVKVSVPEIDEFVSGTMISPSGHILTIKGPKSRGDEVDVMLPTGEAHKGKVLATWPYYGMALIKIDATKASYLPLGFSEDVLPGDQVLSVGNAFYSANGRATRCAANFGIISARTAIETDKVFYDGKVFTTDARINQGQEGGPMVDLSGHLIAINGESVMSKATNAFVSVALPIESVIKPLYEYIKSDVPANQGGKIVVGLTLDNRSLDTGGIRIIKVDDYAAQGGVRSGDQLLSIAGVEVQDLIQLDKAVQPLNPNRLVPIKVYRQGKVLRRFLALQKNMPISTMLASEAYRDAISKVDDSVVTISFEGVENATALNTFKLGKGPFTGLIYRHDGYVLTSSFIFPEKYKKIIVTLNNGKNFEAKRLGRDTGRNISLLKIETRKLSVPQFVSKEQVSIGSTILSLGRTFGGELPEVSRGMVSALKRSAGKATQIDSNLTPGNFGGPSIDLSGRVIGINIPQANRGMGLRGGTSGGEMSGSGIGFVIPISDIDLLFDEMKEGKVLKPAFLGIQFDQTSQLEGATINDVIKGVWLVKENLKSSEQMEYDRLEHQFMMQGGFTKDQHERFQKFAENKPTGAWKAGLRGGDVIVEFNGKKIRSFNVLMNVIGQLNSGEEVVFKIERFGVSREVKAVLGSRGIILG